MLKVEVRSHQQPFYCIVYARLPARPAFASSTRLGTAKPLLTTFQLDVFFVHSNCSHALGLLIALPRRCICYPPCSDRWLNPPCLITTTTGLCDWPLLLRQNLQVFAALFTSLTVCYKITRTVSLDLGARKQKLMSKPVYQTSILHATQHFIISNNCMFMNARGSSQDSKMMQ